jgi:hypothetical protein
MSTKAEQLFALGAQQQQQQRCHQQSCMNHRYMQVVHVHLPEPCGQMHLPVALYCAALLLSKECCTHYSGMQHEQMDHMSASPIATSKGH